MGARACERSAAESKHYAAEEARLTAIAQTAVEEFREGSRAVSAIREKVDGLSSLVYGLTEEERRRIASGHARLAAMTEDVSGEGA